MAYPVADSYSCASGQSIYAGRSSIVRPAWRLATVQYTWVEVPTANKLSDLDPKNNPLINPNYPSNPEWQGTGGQASMISAYSGACYDTATDTMHWPLQEGHGDGAGNEPYKARLDVAAPMFVMLRYPSGAIGNLLTTNDGQEATGVYTDGRPRAIHSYNKPVYVPGVGPVIAIQGNTAHSASGGLSKPLIINETTGETTLFGATNADAGTSSGGGGCYDPTRHAIWWRHAGTGYFSRYNISADTWTRVGTSKAVSGYSSLTYLPDDDCLLWTNDGLADGVRVFDCATGTLHEPSTTGSSVGTTVSGRMQPRWVPSLNAAAYWDNSTNTTIINLLNKPANPRTGTWTISQLSVAPGNAVTPTAKTAAGTYGRFAYSSRMNGFFLLNATNQRPYFFALD